jgi:hypothetical protein
LQIGSGVTLTRIEDTCASLLKSMPAEKTSLCREIINMLQWFAGYFDKSQNVAFCNTLSSHSVFFLKGERNRQ